MKQRDEHRLEETIAWTIRALSAGPVSLTIWDSTALFWKKRKRHTKHSNLKVKDFGFLKKANKNGGGEEFNKKHQTFQREENTNIMMWNCKEQVKDAYTFILSAYVVIMIFLSVGLWYH